MPMEESREAQALGWVQKAKEAMPPETMVRLPDGVESALTYLLRAVETLVNPSPILFLDLSPETRAMLDDLDEYGPGQREEVERIYRGLTGYDPPAKTPARKFVVSFADVELDADDIWPEGDAPENPTPEDVIEVMRSGECAHPTGVAVEWLLIDSLFVSTTDDDHTVEWDGT